MPFRWCGVLAEVSQLHAPLWDGAYSGQSSSAGSTYAGAKVPCGFALSAAPESAASALRGMERRHTHQGYSEGLLFCETGQFLRVTGIGSRRSRLILSVFFGLCFFLSSRLSSGLCVSSCGSPLRASSSPRVPVVAEFPLGSTISGFSPAARGKEIFEDCPAPGRWQGFHPVSSASWLGFDPVSSAPWARRTGYRRTGYYWGGGFDTWYWAFECALLRKRLRSVPSSLPRLPLRGWGSTLPFVQVYWWTGTQCYADGIAVPWTPGLYACAGTFI